MAEQPGRIPPDIGRVMDRNFVVRWQNPELDKSTYWWGNTYSLPGSAAVLTAEALKKEKYRVKVKYLNPEVASPALARIFVDPEAGTLMEQLIATPKYQSLNYVTHWELVEDPRYQTGFNEIMRLADWDEDSDKRLYARMYAMQAHAWMRQAREIAAILPPGTHYGGEDLIKLAHECVNIATSLLGDREGLSDPAMTAFVHNFVRNELRRAA